MSIDPIHQFNIENLFKIGQFGDHAIYFTNSSAYMFLTVAIVSLLMIAGSAKRQLVPGRFQSMAEISYEFVTTTIRSTARVSAPNAILIPTSRLRCETA